MNVFGKIKDAIFGRKKPEHQVDIKIDGRKANPNGTLGAAPATTAPVRAPGTTPSTMQTAPSSAVDVEQQLASMAGGKDLNWRSSIVDLMKLVGIESSYENRKELATELGRSDYSGDADDNIWLHKAVMRELAKNGGKVPAAMLD